MGYRKGDLSQWHGIWVRVSGISPLTDGRWKTTVYILDQRKKRIAKKQVASLKEETFKAYSERIPAVTERLILEHANLIIQQLMSKDEPCLTLEIYAALRWRGIYTLAEWLQEEEQYRALWEEQLCVAFGAVNLVSCDETVLEERMEEMTHRKRRKVSMSEQERKAWIVLEGILECAVREGILDQNPAREHSRKCQVEISTIASKDIARQSLTEEEQRLLLNICLERREEIDLYNAVILQYLCGMSVPELCGLSVGNWQKKDKDDVSWLEITRLYKQQTGKSVGMTKYAYRKIPCSQVVESLLKHQVSQLNKRGLGKKDDPLFANDKRARMTPEEYKKIVKEIHENIIQGGAKLSFVKRGSRYTGKNGPSIFYGDLLRSTTEYNLRTLCGFRNAEVEAFLGRNPVQTYATHYADWTNTLLLRVQAERINCLWHSKALTLNGKEAGTMREGVLWEGHAEAGAEIRIQAQYGFHGVVREGEPE